MAKNENKPAAGGNAPVKPENKPEVQATAAQLRAEGVTVTGIPETEPGVTPEAVKQASDVAEASAAAKAFADVKRKRIVEIQKVMENEGVIYDISYLEALPSIRDAADEISLTKALNAAMARLMKQHKDVVVIGGEKDKFVLAGGTPLKPPAPTDAWKCPRCKKIQGMQHLHDESQPYEMCGACTIVVRRDVAHNLYRIVRDDKTVEDLQTENNNKEAK